MKTKRKAYLATIILTILTIVFAIGIVVNAGNSEEYLIEIINDGSANKNVDSNTEITKKIIREEDSSLIYEASIKNTLQVTNTKEITLFIDTSKSIDINDPESSIKSKANELVDQLFSKVSGLQVSIVDSTGVKRTRDTNKNNVINTINQLANTYGNSVDESLEVAKTTFTNTSTSKLLIAFTDATDTMKKVESLQTEGIGVITVLTNMTRESYEVEGVSTIGDTYMIDEITSDSIIESLNKSLKNIEVKDVFSDKILKYFNFSVVDPENTAIEATADGYIWRVDTLNANTTSTVQFKLTLKDNMTIDENDAYKELETSSNMNISYDQRGVRENYDVSDSPIILLCKKYSVKIKAVNGEYKTLPVEGIEVKVTVQDEKGTNVFNDTLTTDSDGNIVVDNLKTRGNLTFHLEATVNKVGYNSATNNGIFVVYNEPKGKLLSVPETSKMEVSKINNENRTIDMVFPIQTKIFNLDVFLSEKDNTSLKLDGAEFRLIQPTINNKEDLKALYGTTANTNGHGHIRFSPSVMPKDGTYDYILSQITELEGYEPMGNVTLEITFKNGEIPEGGIKKKYNENVSAERRNSGYVVVDVLNENKGNNKFNFELELSDKINTNDKLEGAIYTIESTRISTTGKETVTYENQITDENGKIALEIPGSGFIEIKVTEVRPKVGYYHDTATKTFTILRSDGEISKMASDPTDLKITTLSAENKVKLNLESEMNALQSMIQVKVMDIEEHDIPLPGVKVKLIGTMTNEEYDGIVGEDGIARFLVQPQEANIYQYKIVIDNSSLPRGYSEITEDILVSVQFNGERQIVDGSNIQGPLVEVPKVEEYETPEFTYKGATFVIGVDINEEDAYNFQVKLSERVEGTPIQGAKYDITIDNGITIRKISGRATDIDGKIMTRLMANDNITITVKETKSIPGYEIDETEQVIKLIKENGKFKIDEQNPYEYIDNKNGAQIEDKNIIYYHTNAKKGNDSVLLNLYVNKMDEEGTAINGLPVRVYSDTLENTNGQKLNEKVLTGAHQKGGEGYFEIEKIKVTNVEIPKDSEHFLYIVETGEEGEDIESTLVKLKLTFRYNENKQYVEITNAESTWGNRLIKKKTFDGYESPIAYESNLYLDIFGNYDDVGNFALDLRKVNTDGQELQGAIYDVTITRPDGSKLVRRDLEITDTVEFSGVLVSAGTTIEITEVKAPIGYQTNGTTEMIRIESVSDDGEVVIDLHGTTNKLIVDDTHIIRIDENTVKTSMTVSLVDDSLNTFKFGITTKDKTTSKGVPGFGYYFYSNKGAQTESKLTNGQGQVVTRVGGNYKDDTVTYTIREIQTAKYYKKFRDPITVKVVFTEEGKVDSVATLAAQTDANYGTVWNITNTNTDNGNDIDIEIFNEPQDPLNVNLHTIDKVTGAELNNIEYKITPSVNLPATGTTNIEVGYVSPDSIEHYTISQTNEINGYKAIKGETFSLTYDEIGNIAVDPNNLSSNLEFVSRNGKTVELKVYVEPKVPFSINSIGYFDNAPLAGSEYTISQKDDTTNGKTKDNGIANIYNGVFGTDKEVIYTITENKVTPGYVKLESFEVKVTYNSNREITSAVLVDEANRWMDVTYKQPSVSTDEGYNGNDKGIVQITLKHYPAFLMHIQNEDRLDTDTKLSGTLYSVESDIGTKDDEVITVENGIGTAELDKTLIDDTVIYTIKEKRPAALYQSILADVKVEVVFDADGFVKSTRVIEGNDYAEASKIATITNPRENFEINVVIRNCKMLKFNITAVDSEDETYALRGLRFNAESTLNGETLYTNTIQTNEEGKGTLGFDKDYANETITYTITETEKLSGYQFPSEELVIEVTYDSDGKMIPDTVRMVKGSSYTEIVSIDADTFDINLKIVNAETEEFGVNIESVDKYDPSIKLGNMNYEVSLMTSDYHTDENYVGTGVTDANGETFIQFGKYISSNPNGNETRIVKIVESNLSDQYRPIRATIAVNVTFDANGIITNVSAPGGGPTPIGYLAGDRFVSVVARRHTISVTIKHYPYLFMNVKAVDMYTGEELAAKYHISTHYGPGTSRIEGDKRPMERKIAAVQRQIFESENRAATLEDLINALYGDSTIDRIKVAPDRLSATFYSGSWTYIVNYALEVTSATYPGGSYGGTTGLTNIDYTYNGLGEILSANYQTTDDGEWAKVGIGPTGTRGTPQAWREFYIYEQQEPTAPMQYQKYRPRYVTWEYSKIIAKIRVNYDDKGRIETYSIEDQRSCNNIQEFLEVEILDGTNLGIKIKYAPITTMQVTTRDAISKAELSNVRVMPYINSSEYAARTSHEYRTTGYYTTNSNGTTGYTYWGANVNEGQNEYHINTSLMGWKGYFGSGLVKIHVSYDENGRIAAADVLSTDENGAPNAEIVGGIGTTNLQINILYNRKFNIKINKQDEYDENMKLNAKFNVQSDQGSNVDINSGDMTTLGMIWPGKTVRYNLTETIVPQGHFPIDNVEFYVTFNEDGTISKVKSDSELFSTVDIRKAVDKVRPTMVQDLEVAIDNEAQFIVKLNVMDYYYNEKKLKDVTYSMTNEKVSRLFGNKDQESATGNPITNNIGQISVPVGKAHRNETRVYSFEQTSTPNGYYPNNEIVKLEVEFNEVGKIKDYRIIQGEQVVRIDSERFKNQRYVELDMIGNKPRDIELGIVNKDKLTGQPIPGDTYHVEAKEIKGGNAIIEKDFTMNENGSIIDKINEFKETPQQEREVLYTITQIRKTNTYRKIQPVQFIITFREDGSIKYKNVTNNPSNVKIDVALGGKLQYLGENPVHILLTIENDNAYDLIVKDEDKNYEDLGIPGTKYDITVNGEKLNLTTDAEGLARSLSRTESGLIRINIAEREAGIGYKSDINNNTTIEVQKGEVDYSLDLISNSNPNYADVVVDGETGVINVKFKNETRSSIKLVKDVADVRYRITEQEDNGGVLTDIREIGTDMQDTVAKEELQYELGVTPQNKIRVYKFEQLSTPEDYKEIGTFNVTVEYDAYGKIKKITNDSDRIDSIEEVKGSNDIVVIVNEPAEGGNDNDDDGTSARDKRFKYATFTLVKDNKDVKYEVSSVEVDSEGQNHNAKVLGTELGTSKVQEQLYYDIGNLTPRTTFKIKAKELSTPEGYTPNGTINITATVDEEGFISSITDDCDNAEVKLAPPDRSNNIVLVIGEEYGSLVVLKGTPEVRYEVSQKERQGEQYSNEEVLTREDVDGPDKRLLYFCFRNPIVNKNMIYEATEIVAPAEYTSRGVIQIEVDYNDQADITDIINNNMFVEAYEAPEGSHDVYVDILSEDEIKERKPYTIKVALEEIESNLRINESEFDVRLRKGTASNYFKEVEGAMTSNASNKGYIIEKGVIEVKDIKETGNIGIRIDQREPAEGYKFGNQVTSGEVQVAVTYEKNIPKIKIISDGRFGEEEVRVDNLRNEVLVKVKNEPEAQMEINNIVKMKDEEGQTIIEPIEGSKFTITSEIQTKTEITPTDLNVTTAMTDEQGNTSAKVGTPYLGKTVLYTIHQIESQFYEQIGDIVVQVQYDTEGLIKYYEIISNPDDAVVNGEKGTRNIQVQIINSLRSNKYGYRVVLEKRHINNGEYEDLIPGAKFKIEVEEEYGEYNTTWEAITDQDGKITSSLFNGYGNINIKITELDAPEGFKPIEGTQEFRLNRNKNTGKLISYSSDVNFETTEEGDIIYLRPVNEPRDELYTIILNKADKKTGKMITESPAKFSVKMIGEELVEIVKPEADEDIPTGEEDVPTEQPEEGEVETPEKEYEAVEVETFLGEFTTDNKGKAKLESLPKPERAGTYKYIITETEAPEGYLPLESPVELEVTFVENEKGEIVMDTKENIKILSGDAFIRSKVADLLNITINNFNEKDVNKYTLDITKVDAHTREPIENMAIFKVQLPDENSTSVYTETMENDYGKGKLDYCYIEQDKDYDTRLTRMEIPKEPGIHKYVFKEISPPEGYVKFNEELELTIDFRREESTGKMYIYDINSSNEKYMKINTPVPCTTETVIDVDILNNSVVYTVEYRANDNGEGTENLPATQNKAEDVPINLDTNIPVREGFEFLGWATYKEATEPVYQPGDEYNENADLILYAVWEKATFTVTYDDNLEDEEVEVPDAQTKHKGNDLELSSDIPERKGYAFVGWTTDKESLVAEYQAGSKFTIDEDTTLYAIWEIAEFEVIYDDNLEDEDVKVPDAQIKHKGNDLELSSDIPERKGYAFVGWTTDKESLVAEYQPGDNYTKDEATILYAIWERAEFEVIYDDNLEDEDIKVPDAQTKHKGNDLELSSDIPERDGYEFVGWTTNKESLVAEYQPGDNFTKNEDTTLYAIWKLKIYKITYDDNVQGVDIPVPPAQDKIHNENITLSDMVLPSRTEIIDNKEVRFLFDGWYAINEQDEQVLYDPGSEYTENADLQLHAIWTEEIYLESDEYQIINVEADTSDRRKSRLIYDTEQIHEYNEGDKFIIGIRPQYKKKPPRGEVKEENKGTTLNTLMDNLITNADKVKVTTNVWNKTGTAREEKEITGEELVGTNMTIELTKGKTQSIKLTLVVIGDFWDETYTIAEDGSVKYFVGDGIIMPSDASEVTNRMSGKFNNTGNNLLDYSGIAFLVAADILHAGEKPASWGPDIQEAFAIGSSKAMMEYVKEKGNW